MSGSRASVFLSLPLLAIVLVTRSAIGFVLPSVYVAPRAAAETRPVSSSSSTSSFAPRTDRYRLQWSNSGTPRRRTQSSRLSMAVEPHVLRLQAAELGQRLRGTNLYFVGMMGTGKSTVARALANVMGRYIFLDTDSIIEELLNAAVGDVFKTDGEEAFRSVESQVLDQVHSYVKICVATGGGIVKEAQNWGKMHTGIVVWLDMESTDIIARMRQTPEEIERRPLLRGDDPEGALEKLMTDRRPQYAQADVHVQLQADEDVDDAMMNVINSVLEFIDSNPPKWQQWKDKAQAAGIDWA